MNEEKFRSEIAVLKEFFEHYCAAKKHNRTLQSIEIEYKESRYSFEVTLCPECFSHILYCVERLQECPHNDKPRCRNCPAPCYGKAEWKFTAKVMRFSGIALGLAGIKNLFIKKQK